MASASTKPPEWTLEKVVATNIGKNVGKRAITNTDLESAPPSPAAMQEREMGGTTKRINMPLIRRRQQ
jgi:hypothetical protein